ncbi:hypothetical protein OG898_19690 [Streptomyces sp. NBC_00193]|uniref:hypothetical protein n=1 Tax=unclassified Streptomyces TaxID=2593676 RepID=UPI00225974B4|nr:MULTISPECIES: hypothetical protein [unclassified Streptomyces]MCX5125516.1 hypothetical protein [Streptomyces sp. NBC_00347]MCX5298679.1 hypothetical protein [Streptomyces sp. NBC_00193]
MNKNISAALCTMTALAAVLSVPTAAHAADPFPKGVVATTENEKVNVYLQTGGDTLPENLKVHLRVKGTTARVATLTRFVEGAPGDCEPSCGHGSVRFQADVPKLAVLGDYTVDVEYTGTRGEPVLHQDKATLNYRLRPVFSGLKSANAVSLDRRDTTLSGDIKLYDPRDGSQKPYAGAAFTAASGGVTTALVADAQGHFASKVTVHGTDGDPVYDPRGGKLLGWETAVSLSTEANGKKEQARAAVPVTPVEARIALDSTTVTGPYATRGKVGGSFTWKAEDGTWKPAPGAMGLVIHSDSVATVTAGRFTWSRELTEDTSWRVSERNAWVSAESQDVKVDVTGGTSFPSLTAKVDRNKIVRLLGEFNRGQIPAGINAVTVEVQYSADGKTGWTTRQKVEDYIGFPMSGVHTLRTALPYPGPGFVRMRYAGTPDINGSVSSPVQVVPRTETAIPEFNAAPEPVKKGKPITLTGKLTQADPAREPLAGQYVHYYFRPAGSTEWKAVGYSFTGADGTFTRKYTATQSGSWSARYQVTDEAHYVSSSRVDEVVVTP